MNKFNLNSYIETVYGPCRWSYEYVAPKGEVAPVLEQQITYTLFERRAAGGSYEPVAHYQCWNRVPDTRSSYHDNMPIPDWVKLGMNSGP